MSSHPRAALLLLTAFVASAQAQLGDRPGVEQKEVVPRDQIPPAPARSAAEQLKTFRVAPGFRVELVAADPMVQDPIIMHFDPAGRMWVTEMRGYMNNVDSDDEELPVGRVVVLTGPDGGPAESSTVYADKLVMPRALGLMGGGVLVGEPPNLWQMRGPVAAGTAPARTSVLGNFGSGPGRGSPEATDCGKSAGAATTVRGVGVVSAPEPLPSPEPLPEPVSVSVLVLSSAQAARPERAPAETRRVLRKVRRCIWLLHARDGTAFVAVLRSGQA